ncbi:hypothetical protein [Hymenobacter nivis]|uniref:hypothetical protein n=1 Tax=Hymenobacter nivis TaxID=1850093 RepID=UPI001B86E579|nr:hypothetical protein [Hymenobacter nivis]
MPRRYSILGWQEQAQQLAFATAQVQHAPGAQVVHCLGHLLEALVVEGNPAP